MVLTRKKEREDAELKKRIESIGKRDIFSIPEIKNNPISVILIKRFTFDEKLDGRAMIEELCKFVKCKSIGDKLDFIFTIYDLDNDGLVSSKDLFEIIKMLNRGILDDRKIQNIVDRTMAMTGEYKLGITPNEFKRLVCHVTKDLDLMFGCSR